MLVKRKNEIISGLQEIKPSIFTGPHINQAINNYWMKDEISWYWIQNYEVRIGSFEGAIDLGISSFREFPKE